MNVEIGAEAMLFPEKEYVNGIAVAVQILFRQRPTAIKYYWKLSGGRFKELQKDVKWPT